MSCGAGELDLGFPVLRGVNIAYCINAAKVGNNLTKIMSQAQELL